VIRRLRIQLSAIICSSAKISEKKMNINIFNIIHQYFPDLTASNEELLAFLKFNKVLPMYYEGAKRLGHDADFLKDANRQSVVRSMQMEAALKVMLPLFADNDIRVVLLKGSALGAYVYPSPAMRPMADIDLLIAKEDIEKARNVLLNAGATETYVSESEHTMGHWQHSPPLFFKTISVELHHQLFHTYEKVSVPTSTLLNDARHVNLYGISCQILSPEHQLLHVGYHMFHHAEGGDIRLIWFYDIHLLLEKTAEEFDWQKFTSIVKDNNVELAFTNVLDACHQLLGTKIPDHFRIKKGTDASALNLQWFLKLCLIPQQRPVKIGSIRSLKQTKGVKNKLLFIRGKLFPARGYLHNKYPKHSLLTAYLFLYATFLKKLFIFVGQKIKTKLLKP
jgi:hypothetical protein